MENKIKLTGAQLKEKRRGLYLTQKELATIIGVYQPTVAAWESQRRVPTYVAVIVECLHYNKLYNHILKKCEVI